jgi:hypothetical protein
MSAQDFESFVRSTFPYFIWANVERRAKEGKDARRVRKLRGDDNPRRAVVNAAAVKLLTSDYWDLNPDERDALADRELHNERQIYITQTERLSRPRKPKMQKRPPKMFDLKPSPMSVEADHAEKMAIAWQAKLRHEIAVALKALKNRKHRCAALMLVKDQTLRDYQIAKKCGVAALTVSTFRKKLEALQAAHVPSDVVADDDPEPTTIIEDEALTEPANDSEFSEMQDDVAERALRHKESQRGGVRGARQYSDDAFARGYENHKWKPSDAVFAARKRRLKNVKRKSISESIIQALAEKFGLALQQVIDSAAVRQALMQAEIDSLRQELLTAQLSAENVQAFVAKAEPLCEVIGVDTDATLLSTIGQHPERRPNDLLQLFRLYSGPAEEDAA